LEIFASQGAPPVLMTLGENFASGTSGVVDASGKFGNGINDTGGKICHQFQLHGRQIMGILSDR